MSTQRTSAAPKVQPKSRRHVSLKDISEVDESERDFTSLNEHLPNSMPVGTPPEQSRRTLSEALSYNHKDFVRWAIEEEWRRPDRTPLFTLTRMMRNYLREDTPAQRAFFGLDADLRRMGTWDEFFRCDTMTAERIFLEAWPTIRVHHDKGPIQTAIERAAIHPVTLPLPASRQRASAAYDRFVSVAMWLQAIAKPEEPFLLPHRAMAAALKTDPHVIHTWIKLAMEEGWIVLEKKHTFNKRKGRRSTMMADLTTPEGVKAHMKAATSELDWNSRCDDVKRANGGYPDFWYQEVVSLDWQRNASSRSASRSAPTSLHLSPRAPQGTAPHGRPNRDVGLARPPRHGLRGSRGSRLRETAWYESGRAPETTQVQATRRGQVPTSGRQAEGLASRKARLRGLARQPAHGR